MADTIAVMNEGKIEQMGSPADLYDSPRTAFVANFLGQSNLIKGRVVDSDGDANVVEIHGQKVKVLKNRSVAKDSSILFGIRPEKIRIQPGAHQLSGCVLEGGVISDVSYIGVSTQYQVWSLSKMMMAFHHLLKVIPSNSLGRQSFPLV